MPRSPANNQQIKDARRVDILRAATRVFAKKGFAAAKISDIAREAALSHGLVYHYFENKDAVFLAILEDKIQMMRAMIEAGDTGPGTSVDRMRRSVTSWLRHTELEPDMPVMMARALLDGAAAPQIRRVMTEHACEAYESSVARIREGQKRGEIGDHASAEELASSMICLMRGLAFTRLVHKDVHMPPPSIETVMRLLLPTSALAALTPRPQAEPGTRVRRLPARARRTVSKTPVRKAPR